MTTTPDPLAAALEHYQRGRFIEAEAHCRDILSHSPNDACATQLLGMIARDRGQLNEATAHFKQALAFSPRSFEAHFCLAELLRSQAKLELAKHHYESALQLHPKHVDAMTNLGTVYRETSDFPRALACFSQAIELCPNHPVLFYNMGLVHQDLGNLDQAIDYYHHALALQPGFLPAEHNLGSVLLHRGNLNGAVDCFERVIRKQPDHAQARYHLAIIDLLTGNYERGWPEYEWRWHVGEEQLPLFSQPRWNGQDLNGKPLLVFVEQGLGDTIQFIRYAPLLKERGARVLLPCPQRMIPLLRTCDGIDAMIARGDIVPPFDYYVPLLSVPGLLKTTLDTIPRMVPYLHADQDLVTRWRDRFIQLQGFRIGINWRGRDGQGLFRKRDAPLNAFEIIARLSSVQLVSLQRDGIAEISRQSQFEIYDPGPVDEDAGAFMDTAAIIKNLDLVITTDTAVAHLAGALGVRVWTLLPFLPSWRWLLNRTDTPWYPTMRLFRQQSPGEWTAVFRQLRDELQVLLNPT